MDSKKEALAVEKEMIKWRRYLHQHPELGYDLENTVKFVCEKLDEFGVPYDKNVGSKCSVIAKIKGEKGPGKTIALRADMDALPVFENTDLEFKSLIDGRMHACGHDGHIAIMLGTVKILSEHRNEFGGTVKVIFQPAEELGTGAKGICDAGVLDDVSEIIGLHDGNVGNDKPDGALCLSKGPMMACMDKFTIDIIGKGCHGSMPENGVDPITIGAQIVNALQLLRSREIDSRDPGVISVCVFQAGSAFNTIDASAHLEGTVRAVTPEVREYMAKRIGEVAKQVATGLRGDVKYEFFFQPPPLVNNKDVAEKVIATIEKIFPGDVVLFDKPIMGGEDFAWYLEKVPGTFFFLQNPKEVRGKKYLGHSDCFDLDESKLKKGTAIFVQYVLDQLG